MPQTTDQADAYWRTAHAWGEPDWIDWPVPQQAEVAPDMWDGVDGCFWKQGVSSWRVDEVKTRALAGWDVPIEAEAGNKPWQGSSYGMPIQQFDSTGPKTRIWDLSQAPVWSFSWAWGLFRRDPVTDVALPPVVRREGDPAGSSDQSVRLWDPARKVLVEIAQLQQSKLNPLRTWGTTEWVAGYPGSGAAVCQWDMSKPWNAPGQPRGIVAGCVPMAPQVIRWEEIRNGKVTHSVHGVLPNYGQGFIAPARGSDGTLVGHPVVAGTRLRLKPLARDGIIAKYGRWHPRSIIAWGLWEFGWVQGDKSGMAGGFPLAQDERFAIGEGSIPALGKFDDLRLADFEVVLGP